MIFKGISQVLPANSREVPAYAVEQWVHEVIFSNGCCPGPVSDGLVNGKSGPACHYISFKNMVSNEIT